MGRTEAPRRSGHEETLKFLDSRLCAKLCCPCLNTAYSAYLRSEHWQNLRLEKLATCDAVCHFCGIRSLSNDVHHVKYPSRLRDTQLRHLRVLCRDCHNTVHEVLREGPDINKLQTSALRWRITQQRVKRKLGMKIHFPITEYATEEERGEQNSALQYARKRLVAARSFAAIVLRYPMSKSETPNSPDFALWLKENPDANHVAVLLVASAIAGTNLRVTDLTLKLRRKSWKLYLFRRKLNRINGGAAWLVPKPAHGSLFTSGLRLA